MAEAREKLLEVEDLTVTFGSRRHPFTAVNKVSFDIYKGETFGLVGESGSGKTTIGRAVIRVNPVSGGRVRYKGEVISGKVSRETDRRVIDQIQMIFQDPMASLNERAKVDYIVSEGLRPRHVSEEERQERVAKALTDVGLLPEFASRFPHEFSGGQRQRIGIARALIMEPEFIIADEPISALDVSIRAQVLNLMSSLQAERGLTYLFIAHDLSVVRFISDRIGVIYHGQLMELAESEELFSHPLHPYTRALLSAIPMPDPVAERNKKLVVYDPTQHGYTEADPPLWAELTPGHFVRGSQRELEEYRKMCKQADDQPFTLWPVVAQETRNYADMGNHYCLMYFNNQVGKSLSARPKAQPTAGCLLAAMPLRDSWCPVGAMPPYGWGVLLAGKPAF